jgi:hypothetical protein
MYNKGFYFEIHDLLTQFIAAMDDVVIGRYNKNREEQEKIKVRYLHAPKERIIFDLVNKSQNITVPAISVSINSIQRDETRVFNKIDGIYSAVKGDTNNKYSVNVPMPVPVNLSVSVSIITNYQSDLDQILSNFVPYSNPYLIISWKVPDAFNMNNVKEIRSEVLWDGNISLEYPVDVTASDKFKFIGKTNFTIKGWLFPEAPQDYAKNIYFIDANFRTSTRVKLENLDYSVLSAENQTITDERLINETETVSISGAPYITNLYYNASSKMIELSGNSVFTNNTEFLSFILIGKNFNYTENVLLSSNNASLYNNLTSLNFVYYPTVSGFLIPTSNYTILGNNTLSIKLPDLSGTGNINFVVTNKVGWKDTNSINSKILYHADTNKYFYSTINSSWYNINNWYDDYSCTVNSISLPNGKTQVVIINDSIPPEVNLDLNWVQPDVINASTTGITFSSYNNVNVGCLVVGNATFLGNSTYNI